MEETTTTTTMPELSPTLTEPIPAVHPNGASPPRPRSRRRTYLILAVIVAVVLGGGALGANLALSAAYSPERAVLDYLSAQSRGDVSAMWQNGQFQAGEGSYHAFFTREALAAMMADPVNRHVSGAKITGSQRVDSNTELVTASVSWYGTKRSIDFRVVKDSSRTHWLFYPSWRVVAPTSTLNFTYPNQGNTITIDGIVLPDSSGSAISVITGEHRVVMAGTAILAEDVKTVDASVPSDSASVELTDTLTPAATQAAATAVHEAFASCDASKDEACPNHRYTAPNDGNRYFLVAPDGTHVFYTHYLITLVGDPAATMKTVFESEDGVLSVSGSCETHLAADSQGFDNSGTFDGKLTWNGSSFDSDLTWTC